MELMTITALRGHTGFGELVKHTLDDRATTIGQPLRTPECCLCASILDSFSSLGWEEDRDHDEVDMLP